MRRISSDWTFFYKRLFPLLWFGFLVVFVGIGVVNGQGPLVVIVPIAMIARVTISPTAPAARARSR